MVSRTGTGYSESSTTCSITFSFAPLLLFPLAEFDFDNGTYGGCVQDSNDYSNVNMNKVTTSFQSKSWLTKDSSKQPSVKKSSDGKTIYWNPWGSDYNFNKSGAIYYFLGIG